jgi:glutathione S-transferase
MEILEPVLGLGSPDPAVIARREQNFIRFAAVLNDSLRGKNRGKTWLSSERLTIADFSVVGIVPSAERTRPPATSPKSFAGTKGPLRCQPGGKH